MPAPTSYTESALLALMEDELGPIGQEFGLLETDALQRAVWTVQRLMGVDDVADATDMPYLEAAARWQAWVAAEVAVLNAPDKLKAGTAALEWNHRLAAIQQRLARAESAWYAALATYQQANGIASPFFAFSLAPGYRGF